MQEVRPSKLFSQDSFTPILPFDESNPLDPDVQSDHAEVGLKVNGHVINAWNISNPKFHGFFGKGERPPFRQTHLFVSDPFEKGVLEETLRKKIKSQIKVIAKRFVAGKVNIQIIVEGYSLFYSDLIKKITKLGLNTFFLVSHLNNRPTNWNDRWNVTALMINTEKFTIHESQTFFSQYYDREDSGNEKNFVLPYALLEDKKTGEKMIITGAHISGCPSQFPKTALELLAQTIGFIFQQTQGEIDIIIAGDFNTPPEYLEKGLLPFLPPSASLIKAPYPTHVNPNSHAANYDQAVVILGSKETKGSYKKLKEKHLSAASQALIGSIQKSRIKFLSSQD